MQFWKAFFGNIASKEFFLVCLLFTLIFDWTLTVFAMSGGFHDGSVFGESNPTLMEAIITGNVDMVIGFAIGMALGSTLMFVMYDRNIPTRVVCWCFLILYFYSFASRAFF